MPRLGLPNHPPFPLSLLSYLNTMKSLSIRQNLWGAISVLVIATTMSTANAAITVDGSRDGGMEAEYSQIALQTHTTNWGAGNALANMYAADTGKLLNLFIAGRANDVTGNAVILFIDSKAGGVSNITNNLIKSGGFESDLNNLGVDGVSGLTFESGFVPDMAIRIFGTGAEAYASYFDLQKQIRVDLGRVDNATASHGAVTELRTTWTDVGVDSSFYGASIDGVEMSLNMALLGVPEGTQDVKLMAILVNGDSTYGSNQALGSLDTSADMAGGVNTFNFETEPGTQTLTFSVDRPALLPGDDEDGDGINNDVDPFPLAQTRDITFSVDMNVEAAKGDFTPPSSVEVQFFSGSQLALSTLTLTDPDLDLIYTGTQADVEGFDGDSFGTYKFTTDDVENTNSGYEFGFDRTFNLGVAETTQVLNTVFFSDDAIFDFGEWAAVNAGGQTAEEDFDKDGMPNGIEHFMGETGSSFTPNPQAIAGVVTWPRGPYVDPNGFSVWTTDDLTDDWDEVTESADVSDPASVKFTLPTGTPTLFVRLQVP